MEANATHTPGVAGGRLNGRSGVRGRLAALVASPRRNGLEASNGKVTDEATARFDHDLGGSRALVLHHRRLPGDGSDINHLIVGPAGITVVDSRGYRAAGVKLESRVRRSARARSDLAKPVLAQVEELRKLLADTPYAAVPIDAALARGKVEGPRVLQGLNTPRVIFSGVRTIAVEASRGGELPPQRVKGLAQFLDDALE